MFNFKEFKNLDTSFFRRTFSTNSLLIMSERKSAMSVTDISAYFYQEVHDFDMLSKTSMPM